MSTVETRFQVRRFQTADYVAAVAGGWCIGEPAEIGGIWARSGPAYTGYVNGEVAVCAGLGKLWDGCYEAWAVVTALGRSHPVFVHREVVRGLRDLIAEHNPRRVQAHTNCREPVNGIWAERLGFRMECILRKYGCHGEDYALWTMFP